MTSLADTIYALSSGHLPSGVAVIRVSGTQCALARDTMVGRKLLPRHATRVSIKNRFGEVLDRGLVIWFPKPFSFTGEDCLEMHLHGSVASVDAVLAELGMLPQFRMAEAGEFTRRAFINGKLDLVQAEALSDLVCAETEAQRRLALEVADGRQSSLYNSWRERLVRARALIEAELDFADEADIPASISGQVWQDMKELVEEIDAYNAKSHRAEMVREGFDVVILGAPNTGKSTLINALARRDVAIVTEEPGTTRDLIEVSLNLDGIKVRVTDTAGIREGAGAVESVGIQRALARAAEADLVIKLVDLTDDAESAPAMEWRPRTITVGSKSDISGSSNTSLDLAVSAVTGEGVPGLLDRLSVEAKGAIGSFTNLGPYRRRHSDLLVQTAAGIVRALQGPLSLELRAEELRQACISLGRITGEVDVEDLLDSIFSQFCIGK